MGKGDGIEDVERQRSNSSWSASLSLLIVEERGNKLTRRYALRKL